MLKKAGVSVLVCTRGACLRWIGGNLGCSSRYYNITHIFLRALHVLTWYILRN